MSDSSKKESKSRASSPGEFTSNSGKSKTGTFDNDLTHDDTSFCSYSSLFPKTEKSDDSMKDPQDKENIEEFKTWEKPISTATGEIELRRTLRKEPSWMENIEMTPDLMLRYQMNGHILSKVLQSDFEALLKLNQPDEVNEQLDQLYGQLDGLSKKLSLEDNFTSSCSSSEEKHFTPNVIPSTSSSSIVKTKKRRKFMYYEKWSMLFEENAPIPPPTAQELLTVAAQSS